MSTTEDQIQQIMEEQYETDSLHTFQRALSATGNACSDEFRPSHLCLHGEYLEELYLSSYVIQRLCELLPQNTLATFKAWSGGSDAKQKKLLKKAHRWFGRQAESEVLEACSLARLHGDAYLILFLDDTKDYSKPVSFKQMKDIKGFLAVGDHDISFNNGHFDISTHATISTSIETEFLDVTNTLAFHTSRMIRIPGKIIPRTLRDSARGTSSSSYRNQSVVELFLPAFQGWVQSNVGIIQMLDSHSAFALGMKGLALKTKTKNESGLKVRFQMIISGLKQMKALLYDADQEKAEFINRSYQNIDKVIRSLDTYVASSVDIPLPYLFDGAEAYTSGSRAAREAMALCVRDYQSTHLERVLDRLLWFWLHTQDLEDPAVGDIYDEVEYVWGDGLTLTREEQADLEFKHAQSDELRVAGQATLTIKEVRSRYRGHVYNDDLVVDANKMPEELIPPDPMEMGGGAAEAPGKPKAQKGSGKGLTDNKTVNALTSEKGGGKYTGQSVAKTEKKEKTNASKKEAPTTKASAKKGKGFAKKK